MSISKTTEYFDLKNLSTYSNLAIPTLRDYLKTGLPHYRLKGKILIRRSDFEDWLEQFRVDSGSELSGMVDDILEQMGE